MNWQWIIFIALLIIVDIILIFITTQQNREVKARNNKIVELAVENNRLKESVLYHRTFDDDFFQLKTNEEPEL